jgi:hypothetical protein
MNLQAASRKPQASSFKTQDPRPKNQEPRTMTKYIFLIFLILIANTLSAKKVKFAVDMTGQTVNTTGVHVSGDFQDEAGFEGGDWQSNTTLMTNEEGTQIYSIIVDIPAFAKYEYKFINGDQWYEVEFVPQESRVGYDYNDNRWIYVDSLYNDTTLIAPVLFSGNTPAGFYLLRLKVDMSLQETIDPAGVHVAVDSQNMDPAYDILYSFGNNIYEKIIYTDILTDYADCSYRFVNGNTVAGFETVPIECSVDGNRYIEISKDTVVGIVCFSACVDCNTLGTTENTRTSIPVLYPNPGKDKTWLEFNDSENSHNVVVTDILGNTLRYFNDCRSKSLLIPLEGLPAGIYFIKLETGKRWLTTLRLVVSQ